MNNVVGADDVEQFRTLLGRTTGLRFEEDKRDRLAEVLSSRMLLSRSPSVQHYLNRVANQQEEAAGLAEQLTVGETYFFRDRGQFDALRAILRRLGASGQKSLRMLSAGCSTGDEPYSLAITALEVLPDPRSWDINIVAVDLNERVLEVARSGKYRAWGLRDTPPQMTEKFFTVGENCFHLDPAILKMVEFRRDNLASPRYPLAAPSSVDVVFCRNVLMYLHEDAVRRIVAMLAQALRPGGFLFLGHAENLRSISRDFQLRHEFGAFFYERRKELSEWDSPSLLTSAKNDEPPLGEALTRDTTWIDAVGRSTRRIAALSRSVDAQRLHIRPPDVTPIHEDSAPAQTRDSRLLGARDLMHREQFHEALGLLSSPDETESDAEMEREEGLLRAMLLVCTGQISEAQNLCEAILLSDDLNAGAHYISSICQESLGNVSASIEHSQTACYLDDRFAMPHLQLGRLARRRQDYVLARRELKRALELLAWEDPARILLFGGGFRRQALTRICQLELKASEKAP